MGHGAKQLGWNLAPSALGQHPVVAGAFVGSRVLIEVRKLALGCPVGGV